MPRPGQPAKQLDDDYDKWKTYRELELLHDRLNEFLVADTVANIPEDLKTNYVAGELDSEAKIIAAINSTNARLNLLATTINAVLGKIRQTPQ